MRERRSRFEMSRDIHLLRRISSYGSKIPVASGRLGRNTVELAEIPR